MFILNGTPISPDVAFRTPDGTQFPNNWIRLASPEERAAIGITEVPDEIPHDQRYYWGYDQDGELIPKQLEDEIITPEEGEPYTQTGLKTQHINQNKQTANTLLAPTDWYIIRKLERDVSVPENIASYRTAVIEVSQEREALIDSTTSVAELKELYESSTELNEENEVVSVSPAIPVWPNIST